MSGKNDRILKIEMNKNIGCLPHDTVHRCDNVWLYKLDSVIASLKIDRPCKFHDKRTNGRKVITSDVEHGKMKISTSDYPVK